MVSKSAWDTANAAILQASPLLAVPSFGDLSGSPLSHWHHRYLVASDGVYFQASTPHFSFIAPYFVAAESAMTPLPYGAVSPAFQMIGGGVPLPLVRSLVHRARAMDRAEGAWLVEDFSSQLLRIVTPNVLSSGGTHITYDNRAVPAEKLVIDVHSHGHFPAFFSPTDNVSEDGAYIAMVIGKTDTDNDIEIAARICFYGRTFPLALAADTEQELLILSISSCCGADARPYPVSELSIRTEP